MATSGWFADRQVSFIISAQSDSAFGLNKHIWLLSWPREQVEISSAYERVECWGDDVPTGETTDFFRAVKAKDDETVLFSWVTYPDKAARDEANDKMMNDPDFGEQIRKMPFDAKRMIFGGFDPILDTKEQE